VKTPGGNPVIEVPTMPISPIIVVGPVFEIAERASAPYVPAEARSIWDY